MADTKPAAPAGGVGVPNVLSPARYLAWLYSPPEQQPVLAALCEIESEIGSSLRPGTDHHVAHAKLQWWQEECARSAQGKPVHPLMRRLVAASAGVGRIDSSAGRVGSSLQDSTPQIGVQSQGAAGLAGVAGFVDTAVWDLAGATFETRKELTAYCERWATAMFETALVAGGSSAANGWRALGAAVREIELLADLAREAHGGRLRIPLDELDRTGVDPNALAKPSWPAPLAMLLRERYATLRATLATSVDEIDHTQQARSRGLLAWAALARKLSLRAEHALPGAIAPRRIHAFSDGWEAWRAARRAASGNFRLR